MRVRRGFTLVEVLVAMVIVALAMVGAMGAMAGMNRAEVAVLEKDLASRLAHDKLQEIVATESWNVETSGSFTDAGVLDYTWSIEVVPTGVEGVTGLRLTVSAQNKRGATLETAVYEPPAEGGGI